MAAIVGQSAILFVLAAMTVILCAENLGPPATTWSIFVTPYVLRLWNPCDHMVIIGEPLFGLWISE